MQSNRELIEAAYAAFNRRDIEAALALMDPAVDWPNGMEGGRVCGHEQVRSYWVRQWAQIDPHVEPTKIDDGGNGNMTVDVHQIVRDLTGKILLDQSIHHVYQLEGHRIMRMDIRGGAEIIDERKSS